MNDSRAWEWLQILTTPNADVGRFTRVLDERGLRVPTRLDALAEKWLSRASTERSVLLIAHAGDGKSEFLRQLRSGSPADVELQDFDRCGTTADWYRSGSWLMNDPSQLPTRRVVEFLAAAFSTTTCEDARFVAGINRGLLRAIVLPDYPVGTIEYRAWAAARPWLQDAVLQREETHVVDGYGRVAVPLDRRVLVPAPGEGDAVGESCAAMLAGRVLEQVRAQLSGPSWDSGKWATRLAQVLALVEASGHHVTFREILALAATVGNALRAAPDQSDPEAALAALFLDLKGSPPPPSLVPLALLLRRLDPNRVPSPQADLDESSAIARDARVRREALETLASAFLAEPSPQKASYESAGAFLSLCKQLAARDRCVLDDATKSRTAFHGLARIAWGGRISDTDVQTDVLPVTAPVHPGGSVALARGLRVGLSIGQCRLVRDPPAKSEYVEEGMTLPSLVIENSRSDAEEPRLRLDLELFDKLVRLGNDRYADIQLLGPRLTQINAWFDSLLAVWGRAPTSGIDLDVVTFQTFLGAGGSERPVALRPSGPAPHAKPSDAIPSKVDLLTVLGAAKELNIIITPAACASALIRWAGYEPAVGADVRENADDLHRQALGAMGPKRLRKRSSLLVPAFPWSPYMLGVALRQDGKLDWANPWRELGSDLGAACAQALGLCGGMEQHWRRALRQAWAEDESDFDTHPSARLAHQWLNVGASGQQLLPEMASDVDLRFAASIRDKLVADLLLPGATLPFSRPLRWWLLGTWASWWLMLEALGKAHGLTSPPVFLPYVSERVGQEEYRSLIEKWFGDTSADLESVKLLAQASQWLTPPGAITRFDLLLDGPLLDIVRLCAWHIDIEGRGRSDRRTNAELQKTLLCAGLYVSPPGEVIVDRVPLHSLQYESPDSPSYHAALLRALQRLAMLDAASDGETLFRAPWDESRGGL